jgi:hypothetical protein
MNIIELAREAGLYVGTNLSGVQLVGSRYERGLLLVHLDIDELTRFAHLVRQQVLEEAAEICEGIAIDNEWSDCVDAEKAIRALKDKV